MSYPSPFDRDVITPVQQSESNSVEIKGLYRHLKNLDCEVLLPELYKIVIDYAVDAPDYEELKTAFMKTSRYEGLDIGDNLMEVWREAVLRRNTYDRARAKCIHVICAQFSFTPVQSIISSVRVMQVINIICVYVVT